MPQILEDQTITEFRDKGVTVLRGVFTDWVETLRSGIDSNMADPDPNARIYKGDNGGGRFFVDYCNWARFDDYKDFIFNSPAAKIGAELMESRQVQLFHEHVLVKEAATGVPTPWHQDAPYYCVSGPKTVSLWIPLDEVPRETTLEFVSGSHKWGKSYRPQRFDGSALNEDDGLEDIPDINGDRDQYEVVGWAVSPGDAIAFDYRTIHGAPANNSASRQRRAFSLRLLGDDARFVRREGIVTSPPFPQVALKHGDRLAGDEFPVLLG
ncbi:Phytanoyl-CoA dioxygenase (PhyH) [Roseovarius albus]|uniref:Phytanoyl-CoA dioxygenase (PhyH) n=1 Tax=Roseovarius albus TaxID=1247867 RepID=A0A1X6ZIV2_9RHOB|nr:phytanoyl-CoA dioxygenase family protein [Roseovarius albus]SLN52919.1 Phytanoyl-CoA dioxygenase (PhyH) [Roseovarius albus]